MRCAPSPLSCPFHGHPTLPLVLILPLPPPYHTSIPFHRLVDPAESGATRAELCRCEAGSTGVGAATAYCTGWSGADRKGRERGRRGTKWRRHVLHREQR